jgi:predicted methyltransferase
VNGSKEAEYVSEIRALRAILRQSDAAMGKYRMRIDALRFSLAAVLGVVKSSADVEILKKAHKVLEAEESAANVVNESRADVRYIPCPSCNGTGVVGRFGKEP